MVQHMHKYHDVMDDHSFNRCIEYILIGLQNDVDIYWKFLDKFGEYEAHILEDIKASLDALNLANKRIKNKTN